MVDWSARLWPASFKGVPFYIEKDAQSGGRRIAVHEFWLRDDPFLEDGGESPRKFALTAYLAGDAVDASTAALIAVLAAKGAGPLVLPLEGPVIARCIEWSRDQARDQQGYIAVSATFLRDRAGPALASVDMLANMVFVAADALSAAAGGLISALSLAGSFGGVVDAAVSGFQDQVAVLESLRVLVPVAVDVSATMRDTLSALYVDAPDLIQASGADPTAAERLVSAARDLAAGMAPADAVAAFGSIADAPAAFVPTVGLTPAATAMAINAVALDRLGRMAALAAMSDALAAQAFTTRPEGITARATSSTRFGIAMSEASAGRDESIYAALQDLGGTVADYLSRAITTLAPVVTVSAPASMPALWWAWRLYQDPTRATDLVTRNNVKHPTFMPESFEALAN